MNTPAAAPDLLCLGGSSLDLYLNVPRLPCGDDKMLVQFGGRRAGGLVANTACAAARLGVRSAWTGLLGGDADGSFLLAEFSRFQVETSLVDVLAGQASDFCVILLEPGGERTILVANSLPSPPPLSAAVLTALGQVKLAYTIPLGLDWLGQVSRAVHAGGGKLALDIETSCPLSGAELQGALGLADIIFCSLGGLGLASASPDLQTGAETLLNLGPELVVVTQGSKGAGAYWPGGGFAFSPAFAVEAVDTTGAGDCFHAAFMSELLRGRDLAECLRFANAAAAISTQQIGAREGLPTRAQVEIFLAGALR